MALRKVRYRRESLSDVNMTNMIDICMVLLIIFILVSNFAQSGLNIDVPKVQYVEATGKEHIVVTIDMNGQLMLNRDPITMDRLPAALGELRAQYPEENVFIRVDDKSFAGDLVRVVSIAKDVGFEKVNIPAVLEQTSR